MLSLFLKDFLILKRTILFAAIYPVILIVGFQNSGDVVFVINLVAITYILLISVCAYDEKNKADVLLNSLPISRNKVVLARYVSLYLFAVLAVFYYCVLVALLGLTNLGVRISPMTGQSLLIGVVLVSVMYGIYLPLFFKFGYIKTRIVGIALFFVVFFGLGSLAQMITKVGQTADGSGNSFLQSLALMVNGLSSTQTVLCIVAVLFILVFLSFRMSLKIYRGKEF
ncbi:MAG TPA: ABC-2 transporter permease [Spirochaetales bacterium]|nr:ABC-2 transporter permease [Spirochaetales bacterium]